VSQHDESLLLIVEGGAALEERVENFVILEDITIEPLGQIQFVLIGPNVQAKLQRAPALNGLKLARWGLGWAVVGNDAESIATLKAQVPKIASMEAFSAWTLETRTPIPFFDADQRTLPPELGATFDHDHVSYDKGCYVGQEVLQRIHSRGHTNREWAVLKLEARVENGAKVTTIEGVNLGHITRCLETLNGGFLAGAMLLTKKLEPGMTIKVGGVAGKVAPIKN